jgi:thioredoxin reductase (NADPH)
MNITFSSKQTEEEQEQQKAENIVILGSGPAGWSAALYAARAELSPLVLTGMEPGGQAALTNIIENYPGFPDGIGGAQLGDLFQKQAEHFGARVEFDTATSVDLSTRPITIKTYSKKTLAKSLIITTGASPNHLNVPGEKEYVGKGVSYCATCDGYFFREKKLVVVGGGDSAIEEAIFLTRYASSVTVVHRRDELRAGAILQKRAKENSKISFVWNSVVKAINGKETMNSVRLLDVKTLEESELAADGLFIFIGHNPNTQLFTGQLEMSPGGYIITDANMQTNLPGVFAAGEAADPVYRQVITSAGMGAAAAIQAAKFLEQID